MGGRGGSSEFLLLDKYITLQASRTSLSVSNDITSTPTIGEHDLRVITLRISGWSSPCKVTKLAIWNKMTIFRSKTITQCTNLQVKKEKARDLDNRIMARLGKMTFPPSTLNVKTQYAKWSHLWILPFWSMTNQIRIPIILLRGEQKNPKILVFS